MPRRKVKLSTRHRIQNHRRKKKTQNQYGAGKISSFEDSNFEKADHDRQYENVEKKRAKKFSLNSKLHGVYLHIDGRKYPIKKNSHSKQRRKVNNNILNKLSS
tara:strand:- start:1 stop:309 length:309 start_codon:yes stop_codon:yes gene_type:complete